MKKALFTLALLYSTISNNAEARVNLKADLIQSARGAADLTVLFAGNSPFTFGPVGNYSFEDRSWGAGLRAEYFLGGKPFETALSIGPQIKYYGGDGEAWNIGLYSTLNLFIGKSINLSVGAGFLYWRYISGDTSKLLSDLFNETSFLLPSAEISIGIAF